MTFLQILSKKMRRCRPRSPACGTRSASAFLRLHLKTAFLLFVMTLALVVLSENTDSARGSSNKNGVDPLYDRSSRLSKHPVVIVISFDGFRYNYFKKADTPNMDMIKDTGVSVQYMRNQFVTKTFPNHMSIATGLHTESHGVIDNILYDPKYGNLDFSYPQFWNFENVSMPLWTLNELAGGGRRSGCMMWPGSPHPFGVKNTVPSKVFRWIDNYSFESRIDIVIDWITDEKEPVNVVFLYFEEPDQVAHGYGPESDEVTKYVTVVDNTTGYLIDRLKFFGIYDKVNLIILSDHGFQEVKQQHIINYTSALTTGTYHTYGYSPVLHILPEEGKMEEVYNAMKNLSRYRNFSVFKKEEMDPMWYYSANRRIMPIILVADLGYVFEDFYKNIAAYNQRFNLTPDANRVYGTHGYDNRQLPMHPFFMARGPAFRVGYQGDVFDNIDIYPLVCKILGIKPAPNNGSLNNVIQLLRRKGFAMGSPVGWAMGAAVILGITLVLGIMSALVSGRRPRHHEGIPEMTSIGIREFVEVDVGGDSKSSKHFPVDSEECQALLLSSSTEEL